MTSVATASALSPVTPSASPVSSTQEASSTTTSQESFTQILSGQSAQTPQDAATASPVSSEQVPANVQSPRTTLASDPANALDAAPTVDTSTQPAASATGDTADLGPSTRTPSTRGVTTGASTEATPPSAPTNAVGVAQGTPPTTSPRAGSGPAQGDGALTPSPSSITDALATRASEVTSAMNARAQTPRGPLRSREVSAKVKKEPTPSAPQRSNGPADAGAQGVSAVTMPPSPVAGTGRATKATTSLAVTSRDPGSTGATASVVNSMNDAGSPRAAQSDTMVTSPTIASSEQTVGGVPVVTGPPLAPSRADVASTAQGPLVAQAQGAQVASDTAKASDLAAALSSRATARPTTSVATNAVGQSSRGPDGPASQGSAVPSHAPSPTASAPLAERGVVSFVQTPPVAGPVAGASTATPTASSTPTLDITSLVPGPDSGPSAASAVSASASNLQNVAPLRDGVSSARGGAQPWSPRRSVSSLETLAGAAGASVHVNASGSSVSTPATVSLGASSSASNQGVAGGLGETRLSTLDVSGLSSAISRPLSDGNGTYSVSLAMHPIELGHVQAVMTLSGGELQVSLTAHTEHGHAALAASMNDLKNELARGGVNVTIDLRNPQSQTPDDARHRRATEPTSRASAPTTNFTSTPTPARDSGQIHLML